MKKTFKLNPNNNMLQNCLVSLTLTPFIVIGGVSLFIAVISVVLNIILAVPFLGIFYCLGWISEEER